MDRERLPMMEKDVYCKGCRLPQENVVLRELVDGCMEVVEISFMVGTDSQKYWRDMWLKKAREILK